MKTAIVTGVSGAIGREITKELLKQGYFVLGIYNSNFSGVQQILDFLPDKSNSGIFSYYQVDLSRWQDIETTFEEIFKTVKHIDLLVNVAGIDLIKTITETTLDEWNRIFAVNTTAVFSLSKKVLPYMIERGNGKIVNISSVWGIAGASCEVCYSASKSAIIGYTKALAKEVAPSGITVNCICPGVIDTPMNDCFSEEEKAEIISQIPLGRMGKAEEVAKLVSFLASDGGDYITGQTIVIDGGYIL